MLHGVVLNQHSEIVNGQWSVRAFDTLNEELKILIERLQTKHRRVIKRKLHAIYLNPKEYFTKYYK